jgi:hypothetical protein
MSSGGGDDGFSLSELSVCLLETPQESTNGRCAGSQRIFG